MNTPADKPRRFKMTYLHQRVALTAGADNIILLPVKLAVYCYDITVALSAGSVELHYDLDLAIR